MYFCRMSNDPRKGDEQETYNGVTLGALLILIGLAWFTFPFVFSGRAMIYPWIVCLVGLITLIRHNRKK